MMIELLSEHEAKLIEKLIENVKEENRPIAVNVKSIGEDDKPHTWSEKFLIMYFEKIRIEVAKSVDENIITAKDLTGD